MTSHTTSSFIEAPLFLGKNLEIERRNRWIHSDGGVREHSVDYKVKFEPGTSSSSFVMLFIFVMFFLCVLTDF